MHYKQFVLIPFVLFALAGALLIYPWISIIASTKYHSDVETVYANAIADADDAELANQRRTAEMYNALLRGEAAVSTGGASVPPVDYAEQLTVGGSMCYIDIPKIGVYLPVRHGTGVGRGACGGDFSACRRGRHPCGAVGSQRDGFGEAVFGY